MSDLKPLGSEKLTGQEKLKRIMEIARFNENIPATNKDLSTSEYSITLADGSNYQIVKEKLGYVIKKNISESEVDYIEPMKNRKHYSSYSQAFKRLNLLAGELNRLNENEQGVSFFGEQKKFVLKTPKPVEPVDDVTVDTETPPAAPPPVPSPELPPSPTADSSVDTEVSADETPAGDLDVDIDSQEQGPEGDVDVDASAELEPSGADEDLVTFKTIQKLTGKLTQKIRVLDNKEGMTSEDIKYVINMVLSSLDLKNLNPEDKEDILEKFEEAEEREEDFGGDDMGGEDLTDDSEVEDIQSDMDVPVEGEMGEGHGVILNNIFKESKVDKVLSKYFEISKKEILENKERNTEKALLTKKRIEKTMSEVTRMTESVEQELSAQKFLEENKGFTFVGKTNKKNLVFENKEKQVKISPEGLVI